MKTFPIGAVLVLLSLAASMQLRGQEAEYVNPNFRSATAGYGQYKSSSGTIVRKFNLITISASLRPDEGFGAAASGRWHVIDFRRKYKMATGLAGVLEAWYIQPIIRRSFIGGVHIRPAAELDLGYSIHDRDEKRFQTPRLIMADLAFRPSLMLGFRSNPGSFRWELEAGPYVDLPIYRHVRYTVPRLFSPDITVAESLYPETHFGLQISGLLALNASNRLLLEAHVRLFNEYSLRAGITWQFG